jgi:hypothetical protein
MMIRMKLPILATAALVAGTVACAGGPAADPMDSAGGASVTPGDGHDMTGMQMDTAAMRRHTQAMDSAVSSLRDHVTAVRQLPAARWHEQMPEHTARVAGFLSLIDAHMREMSSTMGQHMGAMMGMSGEEHATMLADVQALRAELDSLQTASAAAVEQQLPSHLERLERLLDHMAHEDGHMHHGTG